MTTRLELNEKLCEILGSRHVYFQPPESTRMTYPAIRYERYDLLRNNADDMAYHKHQAYQLTLIDPNPDSKYFDAIADLPYCTFDRHYAADNLNHDVFTIYL